MPDFLSAGGQHTIGEAANAPPGFAKLPLDTGRKLSYTD